MCIIFFFYFKLYFISFWGFWVENRKSYLTKLPLEIKINKHNCLARKKLTIHADGIHRKWPFAPNLKGLNHIHNLRKSSGPFTADFAFINWIIYKFFPSGELNFKISNVVKWCNRANEIYKLISPASNTSKNRRSAP